MTVKDGTTSTTPASGRKRPSPNGATRSASAGRALNSNGNGNGNGADGRHPHEQDLSQLLEVLRAARDGDFSVRLAPGQYAEFAEVARAFNELLDRNDRMSREISRVGKIIGREGRMTERFSLAEADGEWAAASTR